MTQVHLVRTKAQSERLAFRDKWGRPILSFVQGANASERTVITIPPEAADPRVQFAALESEFRALVEQGPVQVLVAQVNPLLLNPLGDYAFESLLAMLILSFPEVEWLFGTIQGYALRKDQDLLDDQGYALRRDRDLLDEFRRTHGLCNCGRAPFSPLFDCRGLRDWVRRRVRTDETTRKEAQYLPRRRYHALALDEESPYAYLHAYAAYRFGYRAVPVDWFVLAGDLLRKDPEHPVSRWSLVFEDVYLNFPDGCHGVSKLYEDSEAKPGQFRGRAKEWPRLEEAGSRIFITSGHDDKPMVAERNKTYVMNQKSNHRHIHTIFKPYAGIFKIWEESELGRRLRKDGKRKRIGKVGRFLWRYGLCEGPDAPGMSKSFIWPPKWVERAKNEEAHGHSSPGVLSLLATHLLDRARDLANTANTVEKAVRGAVLATDALELLGGRTPTLAIEALRLKHRFEVLAECLFSGVEHHIDLEDRMVEIRRTVDQISRWFGKDQQESAALNAEMQVLLDIVYVLHTYNQFDEEEECMDYIRELQRKLWIRNPRNHRNPINRVIQPIWIYINWLLGTPTRFVGAILTMLLLGGAILALATSPWPPNDHIALLRRSLDSAFNALFTFNPSSLDPYPGFLWHFFYNVGILIGIVHLGVFISRLYTWIARK